MVWIRSSCGNPRARLQARLTTNDDLFATVETLGDDGKLRGLVSIGDVNAYHVTHQEATIEYLNEYIYGRA